MVDLLRTRSRNKKLQALGNRISISQTDEIKYMKQWLEDRGQPVSMAHGQMDHSAMGHDMKAMAGMDMGSMPMMPGMLTPAQMKALAKASGPAFDRLFLTGMIQHHTGALMMVEDLFDTARSGPGQRVVRFRHRRGQHPARGNQNHAGHAEGEKMIANGTSRSLRGRRGRLTFTVRLFSRFPPQGRPPRLRPPTLGLLQSACGLRRSARGTQGGTVRRR